MVFQRRGNCKTSFILKHISSTHKVSGVDHNKPPPLDNSIRDWWPDDDDEDDDEEDEDKDKDKDKDN